MKILICDDNINDVNELKNHVEAYISEKLIQCSILAYVDPEEVLEDGLTFDIAFLDYKMKSIDGITLAKKLKDKNADIVIFFITNYPVCQDDAMDLRVFRFFDKPYSVERLYSGLDKAMEYINDTYLEVYLPNNQNVMKILVNNILYIKYENRKVVLVTKLNEHIIKSSFDEICEKLPQTFFYRVHKSFFVNMHYIENYTYKEIILSNNSRISIAPSHRKDFRKYWFDYVSRR